MIGLRLYNKDMRKWWLMIGILVVAAFLRFYNLADNFSFTGDEEHQATLAMTIVRDFHPIWIGVNAAHTGFYLGPYWTYFSAFWLWLSGGDPLLTGYVAALIGIITTGVVIFTGKELFGFRVGIMAGLLYATLPLLVYFDQKYWNPSTTPLLSLLLLLSLYKAGKNPKWLIMASFCFGLVFHTHLSLVPIGLVGIYCLVKNRSKKILAWCLVAFVLAVTPLIIFDYYHKGSNILTPLRFGQISEDQTNKIDPIHHLKGLSYSLGRLWYLQSNGDSTDEILFSCSTIAKKGLDPMVDQVTTKTNPPLVITLISVMLLLIFLINKKTWRSTQNRMLATFILLIGGFFLFFPGGAYEYYLLGIFPLILFIPGIMMDYFPDWKRLIWVVVVVAAMGGIYTVWTNTPQFGYQAKIELVKEMVNQIGNKSIEVRQNGLCHYYEGWRYLMVINGKTPLRSDSDEGLGWLYSEEISTKSADLTVLFQESRSNSVVKGNVIKKMTSKGFSAYILSGK